MKILFIGGTGTISRGVSKLLLKGEDELYILNRGNNNNSLPKGATFLIADISNENNVKELLKDYSFDVVVDWIAYRKEDVEIDQSLFKGKTKQFVFISSVAAYLKPIPKYPITEDVPLGNKYRKYADNKRICEEYLLSVSCDDFNVTIVRPAHTFSDESMIAAINSWKAPYTIIDRLLKGKKTIIPGDGTSLWTLTYNEDFAEGFIRVLGNKLTYNEAYHITSNFIYTWERINEILCETLGVAPNVIHIPTDFIVKHAPPYLEEQLRGSVIWSTIFNNDKIRSIAPDYSAKTKYEEIAPIMIKRLLDNPSLQSIDDEFNTWYDNIIDKYELKSN